MIPVIYLGPSDEVYLPGHEITVSRAVEIPVPDVVAGREPGPWRPADLQEVTPGGGWTPEGWPLHLQDDGVWLTRDPGVGLLAQVGTWARAGSAAAVEAVQREIEHLERLKAAGLVLAGGHGPEFVIPASGQEG